MSVILSYELRDNPRYEYEIECDDLADAKEALGDLPEHMIVWWDITDQDGECYGCD